MVGPSLNTHNLALMKPSAAPSIVKFLCSYGGKILPRYTDGKLRYHGGDTRVLAVDRSVSFAELLVKMGELCGTSSVSLRCQLPGEDLDALVSITCDEDLANLIEEYDRVSSLKVRAFLSPPKSTKKVSPPPSANVSRRSSSSAGSPSSDRCTHQIPKPIVYQHSGRDSFITDYRDGVTYADKLFPGFDPNLRCKKFAAGKVPQSTYYAQQGNCSHVYLVHNDNHWQ